jgi:hypothetical protein
MGWNENMAATDTEESGVTARLAWTLWAMIALGASVVVVVALLPDRAGVAGSIRGSEEPTLIGAFLIYVVSSGTVGALLAAKRPANPIGWLLLVSALAYMVGGLIETYIVEAFFVRPGSLPALPWIVWIESLVFGLSFGLTGGFVLLLFPTGRLPSQRWRPVAWAAATGLALLLAGGALAPDAFESLPIQSPLQLHNEPLLLALEASGFVLLFGAVLAGVGSLVVRYRLSRGEERQQLKWVAFSVLVLGFALLAMTLLEAINGEAQVPDQLENLASTATLALMTVAIGVAILRYRLYDIDLVINRTLVYGTLTLLLGALYVGGVVGLPMLLPLEKPNDVVVAASTLAVAALFSPLRRTIQEFVDRRFYRTRYDAQQTIEAFSSHLKGQADLESLTRDLQAVVRKTVQPTVVSLWLRSADR